MEIVNQLKSFFTSVFAEYKKVTWPSRKQVISATIMVGILVVFFSIYIGFIDFILTIVMANLLR